MDPSKLLRIVAIICFVVSVFVPTPVLLVPLGLAIWCASTIVP
jgi:hypothetical protein